MKESYLLSIVFLALATPTYAQFTVVNGASFLRDVAVAPGSWVTAWGTFTGLTAAMAPGLPIPKTLSGVTISVDGVDAPVHYVSATQNELPDPRRDDSRHEAGTD